MFARQQRGTSAEEKPERARPARGAPGAASRAAALQARHDGGAPRPEYFSPASTGVAPPQGLRSRVEAMTGTDLSHARLHSGTDSSAAAAAVDARAVTVGSDVHFASGQLTPGSKEGDRLIAHELAHVAQPVSGAAGTLSQPGDAADAQADVIASRALSSTGRAGGGFGALAPRAAMARQTWGTAATTAPPAQNKSPGDVFKEQLHSEVAALDNAAVIVSWIETNRIMAGGATFKSFTSASLFSDTATMKKLKPPPQTDADLQPTLELLAYYGVITSNGAGTWNLVLLPMQQGQFQEDVDTAKFKKARGDITAFSRKFDARFDAQGHPLGPIVVTDLLEKSLAAGRPNVELKEESAAQSDVDSLNAQIQSEFVALRTGGKPAIPRVTTDSPTRVTEKDKTFVLLPVAGKKDPVKVLESDFDKIEPVATGTSAATVAVRTDLEKKLAGAEKVLTQKQAYRTFSLEMLFFLRELVKRYTNFKAGTYPRHGKFAEFAADIFLSVNVVSGFYDRTEALKFVDAVNAVAEAGHPRWGKFAWQIVYNDTTLQGTVNAKYGARMSSAPGHGPDNLHMHLDIRPLNPQADVVTGYSIDSSGRVVLD